MGFFSKVFKGVGKVFRKIGRGLKKVVGKIGKFMGKIGIVGQIGLSLLLPGIGAMFGKLAGAMMGSSSAIISGAGNVLNAAVNIGTKVGSTFKTITEGVTKVMGEVATVGLDKLGLSDSTFGKYLAEKGFTGDIGGAFTDAVSGVKASVGDLFSSNTLTGLNKYAADAAIATQTATATEAVLESVPDSLAAPADTLGGVPTTATPSSSLLAPAQTGGIDNIANYQLNTGNVLAEGQDNLSQYFEKAIPQQAQEQATKQVTEAPGYIERLTTAAKDLPKNLAEKGVSAFENIPETLGKSFKEGVSSAAKSATLSAFGIETRPEYSITNVAGFVPTIDMSSSTDIGTGGSGVFNPIQFMEQNVESFNLYPYGQNAQIYNYGQQYKQLMTQRGF